MFEIIGMVTVAVIALALLLWVPLLVAFGIGWVSYKLESSNKYRDKSLRFVGWYADHVLKPVFDPIVG